jgi:prevent-host-death family protein
MQIYKIHSAKTNLSKLLKQVEAGEEIIIARGNKEIARLSPIVPPASKSRGYGAWKGLFGPIPDSVFFDPLPEEELALWEGKNATDP